MHHPAMLNVGTSALLRITQSATAIILVVSPNNARMKYAMPRVPAMVDDLLRKMQKARR